MTESKIKAEKAENFIHQGLSLIDEKKYPEAESLIKEAYEIFKNKDLTAGISICLSLLSFLNYSEHKTDFESSLALIHVQQIFLRS